MVRRRKYKPWNKKGWLYAMSTESQPGQVKIGMMYRKNNSWDNPEKKMSEKERNYNTTHAHPYHRIHYVPVMKTYESEQKLFDELEKQGFRRLSGKRKWKQEKHKTELFEVATYEYSKLKKIINKYSVEHSTKYRTTKEVNSKETGRAPVSFNYGEGPTRENRLKAWLPFLGIFLLFILIAPSDSTQESSSISYPQDSIQPPIEPTPTIEIELTSEPEPEPEPELEPELEPEPEPTPEPTPEPEPEPVIETFQFEFQTQIMTNEEIIAEVNTQIGIYQSESSPIRARNVAYLADHWDLSEELTGPPTAAPRTYSIFTETIDGKTVQMAFKTDGLKTMVSTEGPNPEIIITN